MRVAVVHNRDASGVIDAFGPQNRKRYNPRTVLRTHMRSSTATVEDSVNGWSRRALRPRLSTASTSWATGSLVSWRRSISASSGILGSDWATPSWPVTTSTTRTMCCC